MVIIENYSLKQLNTFKINAFCRYFVEINSVNEFKEILNTNLFKSLDKLVLGGGSNILFTKNFNGLVLKNQLKGIKLVQEDLDYVYVEAGAGEVWNDFVNYCVNKNYGGVENLSLIPGSVGASPIQNIGAYGVELKDVFYELEAININTLETKKFSLSSCKFGYRDSVFKNELKNTFIILSVTLKLNKKPSFNTSYGTIEKELVKLGETEITVKSISKAVCSIRSSKLPNPEVLGNAGSFFKNPVIDAEKFEVLKKMYPNIIAFVNPNNKIKIAAGWLIEECGWKGKRLGNVGSHKDQALVIVNYDNASGKEVFEFSSKIIDSVKEKFNVELEREVNIL